MKRLSLLLLDANVVIYLFELGIWEKVVSLCDIHLARTVIDEARFYEDDQGVTHPFDLSGHVDSKAIAAFDVLPSQMDAFFDKFDPVYLEKLDAGEAESLAYLLTASDEMLICSADAIVFCVLGNLDRSAQGISLDEVLQRIGQGRRLRSWFGKPFRDKWTAKGVEERLRGFGTKAAMDR